MLRTNMDELLKHAFCSFGIVFLVVRFGQSATSLIASLDNRRVPSDSDSADPDHR